MAFIEFQESNVASRRLTAAGISGVFARRLLAAGYCDTPWLF
jgi:hypothetical protein